jgi:hypothetical protein
MFVVRRSNENGISVLNILKDTPTLRNQIHNFYDNDPFKRRDDTFDKPLIRLANLKLKNNRDLRASLADRRRYINYIEQNYDRILKASIIDMRKLIREFGRIIPVAYISKKFSDDVKEAMGYKDMRKKEFPAFFSQNSIKTCVYCHTQLTLTITKSFYQKRSGINQVGDIKDRKALLELDHIYPASKYPFLSTSLYNLLPVCGNCNGTKNNKPLDLEMYTAGNNLDIFRFSLEPQSLINYELSKDIQVLKVLVTQVDGGANIEKKYNDLFDVKESYNMHHDILEELLLKKHIYNKPYVQALANRFKKLFPDELTIQKLVVGNYVRPEEVHKRPMAKFMQDISRDIGLI